MNEILVAIVVLAAAVFAVAAASKLRRVRAFREELSAYELLPGSLLPVASVALPLAELAVAAACVMPATRRAGAVAAIVLLLLFSATLGSSIRRGRKRIACACFGRSSQHLHWGLVLRNVALATALVVYVAGGAPTLAEAGVAGICSVVLATAAVVSIVELVGLRATLAEGTA